jgi:hypothetical protein
MFSSFLVSVKSQFLHVLLNYFKDIYAPSPLSPHTKLNFVLHSQLLGVLGFAKNKSIFDISNPILMLQICQYFNFTTNGSSNENLSRTSNKKKVKYIHVVFA